MLAFRVFLHIGIRSNYRKPFWRAARHALRRGQIDDLISEIRKRSAKGERTLVTTLTKRMAEDLTTYLEELNIKVS